MKFFILRIIKNEDLVLLTATYSLLLLFTINIFFDRILEGSAKL